MMFAPVFWEGSELPDVYLAVRAHWMDQIAACSGSDLPGFMAVGTHPDTGEMYLVSNNEGNGWGATPNHDGSNALQHLSTTAVRNTSMEVLEHKSPIFHERLELRQNSGGAGRWRGGLGVCRQVKFLATGEVLSMKKKTKTKPWALRGGHEPETNAMIVWPETGSATFRGAGGGWGDPLDRPIELVRQDVVDGYVSVKQAGRAYGVKLEEDGTATPTGARLERPPS